MLFPSANTQTNNYDGHITVQYSQSVSQSVADSRFGSVTLSLSGKGTDNHHGVQARKIKKSRSRQCYKAYG